MRAHTWVTLSLPIWHRIACFPLHALLLSLVTVLVAILPDKLKTTALGTTSKESTGHQHEDGQVSVVHRLFSALRALEHLAVTGTIRADSLSETVLPKPLSSDQARSGCSGLCPTVLINVFKDGESITSSGHLL